jgi:glutaredoxin
MRGDEKMNKKLLLFRLAQCPYCKRAEKALDNAQIQYTKIDINPNDRSAVQLLSGQPSVPILVEVIGSENQDDDILAAIERLKRKD